MLERIIKYWVIVKKHSFRPIARKLANFLSWAMLKRLNKEQQRAIWKKLSPRHQKLALKFFETGEHHAQRKIESVRLRLYSLGFSERPISELQDMIADDSKPVIQRYAARELARWHANQFNEQGAESCLKLLALAKNGEKDLNILRRFAIIQAECLETLGDIDAGKLVIASAIKSMGPSASLYLSAANFEVSIEERIKWINKALALTEISAISFDTNAKYPSIDCLRPHANQIPLNQTQIDDIPKVTVIVPAYNAAPTIQTALNSILAQTWTNLEVFVVDDCSSDNTIDIIDEYLKNDTRVKLIKSKTNRGPYVARNLALKESSGVFVTNHDIDDWSHPEKIEKQVRHLLSNSAIIGNTSEQARTTPELKFYRGRNFGNIVFKFPSSFLFRREPVMKSIGFWDCVRFGADNEFIRRARKVFGKDAVIDLATGPLTFYRKTENTLTENAFFGHHGIHYMGARKEYYEAQTFFHENARDLYYKFPQRTRPFPVPEPMRPDGERSLSNRRHFDVIIASDFRMIGGSTNSNLEEIKAQKRMGLKTGLIQMSRYDLHPDRGVLWDVRQMLDSDRTQMLVYGEKVSSDLLVIRYPPVLQEKQIYLPDVETKALRIIVNQPPMSDYGPGAVLRYDIKQCHRHTQEIFGKAGVWHPIGPQVRDALYKYHEADLKSIVLSEEDWTNIIDVDEWQRKARPVRGNKVRIGRHSRDHAVKWPDDPEKLLSIYPSSGDYEVHILGGAETAVKVLGYLPKNWHVLDFGAVHPKEFLSNLDIFIYFTNPGWVESFGRVIIEAMAVGVPVILPHNYRELFNEAAIYVEPHEVKSVIDHLMRDDQFYHAQVETAYNYVERNFGYSKHAARLEKFLSASTSSVWFKQGGSGKLE